MTLMKRRARGAKRTICRMELIATRMAQYSESPPARPVQMSTWDGISVVCFQKKGIFTIAIHRARPTRMRPSRRAGLSGRKAHANPS